MERLDALCKEIVEAAAKKDLGTINMEQCSVLAELAAHIQKYVDEESICVWATKVMEELSTVLKRGLQLIKLCDGTDVFVFLGSTGQFSEIIEDAMCYIDMIKRVTRQQLYFIKDLYDNLESRPFDLERASLQDKGTLIKILKSQHGDSRSVPSMLETGLYPEIEENELYLDKKTIGCGSFGKITFGKWRGLPIAVKEFHYDSFFGDELRVFNELLDAGSNPHVVQMFGYTRKNELVLEQMDTDLKEIITVPRPLLHSVDIILQIAKGMMYLHKNNVVHRDLKPANLLVKFRNEESPLIKVTDFGVSKENFESAMSNTDLRGTLFYMAPEMEQGTKYSRKVDVYSFGLICNEILAGKLRQFRKEELPLPPEIPGELAWLISSCLQNDGAERPDFENICSQLWLVKEGILIREGTESRLKVIRRLHIYFTQILDRPFSTSYYNLVVLTGVLEDVERSETVKSVLEKIKNLNLLEKFKNVYLEIRASDILPEVYSCAEACTKFANSVVDLMHAYPLIFTGIFFDAEESADNWVAVLHKIRETSVAVAVAPFKIAISWLGAVCNKVLGLNQTTPFKIAISCPMFPGITWPTERALHFADEIYVHSDSYNTMSEVVDKYVKLGVPPSKIFIHGRSKSDPIEISLDEAHYIVAKKLGGLVKGFLLPR